MAQGSAGVTRHYCCYFDHRYIPRALAMIRSLHRFESDSVIWALCLDEACYKVIKAISEPNVRLIRMEDFESANPALLAVRNDRSLIEYYFTCTPSLVRFVMGQCSPDDTVTYVDSDLYFFSDPNPLHEELGKEAVSLTPHRFPEWLRDRERYGIYNVGWLGFRNDVRGRAVAEWWRDRCNEWCFDVLQEERFADQKYLDRFAALFDGVVVLGHDGANVAPWNLGRYSIERRDGMILIDGKMPLIFFHFHGLKQLSRFAYRASHRPYRAPFRGVVRRAIYRPYIAELAAIAAEIERYGSIAAKVLVRDHGASQSLSRRLTAGWRRAAEVTAAIFRAEIVYIVARRAI